MAPPTSAERFTPTESCQAKARTFAARSAQVTTGTWRVGMSFRIGITLGRAIPHRAIRCAPGSHPRQECRDSVGPGDGGGWAGKWRGRVLAIKIPELLDDVS